MPRINANADVRSTKVYHRELIGRLLAVRAAAEIVCSGGWIWSN